MAGIWGDLGLGALTGGINTAVDAFQQQSALDQLKQLGQQIQSGDLTGAAGTALAHGDLATGLKLYQMKMDNTPPAGIVSAIGGTTTPNVAPVVSSADPNEFAKGISPAVLEASKATGVDPRIIVAQAALESDYGRAAPGNNLFGIKSTDGSGNTLPTTEIVNGRPVVTNATFAAFKSPEESVSGYADFINRNPRYAGLKSAKTFDDQIKALAASGYATDPYYGAKVRSIASRINPTIFAAKDTTDAPDADREGGSLPIVKAAADGDTTAQPMRLGKPPASAPDQQDAKDQAEINAKTAEINNLLLRQGSLTKTQLEGGWGKALQNKIDLAKTDLKNLQDKTTWTELDPSDYAKHHISPNTPGPILVNGKGQIQAPLKAQNDPGETQRDKTAGELIAKALVKPVADYADNTVAAHDKVVALNALANAASDPNLTTGAFADKKLELSKVFSSVGQTFGIQPSEDTLKSQSAGEMLQKFGMQLAGAQAKGVGGSRTTNFELDQFLRANPNITMTPQGIVRLTNIMQQMAAREEHLGNEAAAYMQGAGVKTNYHDFRRTVVNNYDQQYPIKDLDGTVLSQAPVSAVKRSPTVAPPAAPAAMPARVPDRVVSPDSAPPGMPKVNPNAALTEAQQVIAAHPEMKDEVIKRLRGAGIQVPASF